jgi:hypothetical protein
VAVSAPASVVDTRKFSRCLDRCHRTSLVMNFFRTRPRTPVELVRALKDAVLKLDATIPGGDTRRKVCDVRLFQHVSSDRLSTGQRGHYKESPLYEADSRRRRWSVLLFTSLGLGLVSIPTPAYPPATAYRLATSSS